MVSLLLPGFRALFLFVCLFFFQNGEHHESNSAVHGAMIYFVKHVVVWRGGMCVEYSLLQFYVMLFHSLDVGRRDKHEVNSRRD